MTSAVAASTAMVMERTDGASSTLSPASAPPVSHVSVSKSSEKRAASRAAATNGERLFLLRWLSSPCFWTALAAVAAYVDDTALHGTYVYDDAGSVLKNEVVIGKVPVREVCTRNFWGVPMTTEDSHKSFGSITTLTLWANYKLGEKYDHILVGDRKDQRGCCWLAYECRW